MDPISGIGAAASSLQLAGFLFKTTLATIQLIKDLHELPARLKATLADVEASLNGLSYLQSELTNPKSRILSLLGSDKLSRLTTIVDNGHAATTVLDGKLKSVFGHEGAPARQPHFKAAYKRVLSLMMEKDVEVALTRIQRLKGDITLQINILQLECQANTQLSSSFVVEVLEDRVMTEAERTRNHIDTAFQNTKLISDAEMRSMRDAMLSLATGERQNLSSRNQTLALKLSDTDTAVLAQQISKALVEYPRALSQACETVLPMQELRRVKRPRQRGVDGMCTCSEQHHSRTRRFVTYLRFRYETETEHQPTCLYAKNQRQSWSYNFSLALIPLISKTVTFSLGARSQGGAWAVTPPIKVVSTVSRKSSPMFRAFDTLYELQLVVWRHSTRAAAVVWSYESELNMVQDTVKDMLATGTGSLTDRDECGRTLLHEIAFSLYRAGKDPPQLKYLLRLAEQAGVDVDSEATADYVCAFRTEKAQDIITWSLSFPSIHARFDLLSPEYFGQHLLQVSEPVRLDLVAPGCLKILHSQHPELAGQLHPLCRAVWQRSVADLRAIVERPGFQTRDFGELGTSVVHFASLHWLEGFSILVAAGFDPWVARADIIENDNIEAYRIASQAEQWNAAGLLNEACCASDTMQQLIVDDLQRQQHRLQQLCCDYLNLEELSALGSPQLEPLDTQAYRAYEMLKAKGVKMPFRNLYTDEGFFDRLFSGGSNLARGATFLLLKKLYAAGFRGVDAVTRHDKRVGAFTAALWQVHRKIEKFTTPLLWLLEAGSDRPASAWSWPSALFDIAMMWCMPGYPFEAETGRTRALTTLLQSMSRYCDIMQRDSCDCYCSRSGCLPSRLFLQCKFEHRFWRVWPMSGKETKERTMETQEERDEWVEQWCHACSLDQAQIQTYLEDAVRVEVFGRLGMIHTCCFYDSCGDLVYTPQDEQEEVQEEDVELKAQLEMIMKAYTSFRDRYVGSNLAMLKEWWLLVDQILPELSLKERHLHGHRTDELDPKLSEKRDALERETLARSGYAGLDFDEIIRRHFKEYLEVGAVSLFEDEDEEQVSTPGQVVSKIGMGKDIFPALLPVSGGQTAKGKRRNSF